MSIESRFDIPLIAAMALKEKQVQQNYRPIIAVHKWFARRPGTLFRALILSEFSDQPLAETFFRPNAFPGRLVADPFMGGGSPILEANRLGCDVLGCDINPMATWIVREMIEHLDLDAYRSAAQALLEHLGSELREYYLTDCPRYGDRDVPVKYFMWVKTTTCEACLGTFDLFPGYLLADDTRHPRNVLVCPDCGDLNEVVSVGDPGACSECGAELVVSGPASRGHCKCPHCGHQGTYPRVGVVPEHRMFAIEYHNPARRGGHAGRFFKKADTKDLERYRNAAARWAQMASTFVPDAVIPRGDETLRLHRWGYARYRDLFNARQLLGLELSCERIAGVSDDRLRHALATNLSDLLRYQNMLCRYDTMALKSLDVFSIHGFPVGLVQCESNLLGIPSAVRGMSVGSGGWTNVVEKYAKAKQFCSEPFEVRPKGRAKEVVRIPGEWIGEVSPGKEPRLVAIRCTSSTGLDVQPESFDAVLTDPPYLGNVQYGELMDFCYVWLRRLVGSSAQGFDQPSTTSPDELTGNQTQGRNLEHFTEGLAAVYRRMGRGLKRGAPLAFTFHHNSPMAYHAVGVAILDAGLACTATLPCPAEMGGSIHIHGTTSSIVDTVFVCRASNGDGILPQGDLTTLIRNELEQLRVAGMTPTVGDARCITMGHLTRVSVQYLRNSWSSGDPTITKLTRFGEVFAASGDLDDLVQRVLPSDVVERPEQSTASLSA